jgi:2-polyprenyl-3-methyl-5-hydroxy-6-metoxy-1,4-benzoquinol methylase
MNTIKHKFRGLVHRRILPKWMQRATWNREYAAGEWDSKGLHTPNDPIHELFAKYCADRNICDIGCGPGDTIVEMPPTYRSYTGIDISDVALGIATRRAAEAGRERVTFVQGFMHTFTPKEKPDVFLFRETLMYVSRNPSRVEGEMECFLRRYAGMLAPDGIMILRLCAGKPNGEYLAHQVETVVRGNFEVIECRHPQEPAALLLVFQPFRHHST